MNRDCIMIHLEVELTTALLNLCTLISRDNSDVLLYRKYIFTTAYNILSLRIHTDYIEEVCSPKC